MVSLERDESTRHLSQRSNQNTSLSRFTRCIPMFSISKAPRRAPSTEDLLWLTLNSRSTPGSGVPNNGFGKPNHKAFQLVVLAFQAVQRLFQSRVPVNLVGTIRPSLLRSNLLHCPFPRFESTATSTTRKSDHRKFGTFTDANTVKLRT
jgi:hypothetical protein